MSHEPWARVIEKEQFAESFLTSMLANPNCLEGLVPVRIKDLVSFSFELAEEFIRQRELQPVDLKEVVMSEVFSATEISH